ncbi:unnamed protein product [Laminaria digitata]
MISGCSLLLLLLPCSALAGGTITVNIKDLVAVSGIESLNIQGNYHHQITNKVAGRASYVFNKDRLFPAAIAASTSTDTNFGRLQGAVAVDPQEMSANFEATLRSEELGAFSTSFKANEEMGGVLGPLRWTSNPVAFPFALKEPTPMVIAISHDVTTKEGHLSIAAKLNNNLDGKLMLPSGGDPVAMLVASHSPDKHSDIRVSARVLDLLGSGVGNGAVGVTYRRDLDTVQPRQIANGIYRTSLFLPCLLAQGSGSRVTLEGKDTGDFGWSLSNTSRRMTLILSGRGRFARRRGGGGVSSTVSLRQSFRFF